jgi:thermitase
VQPHKLPILLSSVSLRSATAVAAALTAFSASAGAQTPEFAPGRILMQTRAGLADHDVAKVVREHGGSAARRIGQTDLHIVDVPPGLEGHAVERLSHNPHIKFAELDRAVEPAFVPNDPYFGSAWHLPKIGASAAWDIARGTGVTIAILDTGVDASHPDLAGNLVPGWNFYSNNSNTSPVKPHGTWVAGAAAAVINNTLGVASIAGGAKIMPLRVTDSNGTGYWSMIAKAITYAADHGARVANVSFEGLLQSSAIVSAASYMKAKNGLVTASAGNTGGSLNYTPSTSMITVSATDANDNRASFSSYGKYVTMSAPGANVWTVQPGGGYTQGIGTSFSAPVVAGTIALMMSAKPSLSSAQVESLLLSNAVDLGAAGTDVYFGKGRVNAGAAVRAASGGTTTTPSDTTAPTVSIPAPVANSTVSGLVPVNVTAADNVGVTKVQLYVNGERVATDISSPFAFSWDSTRVANGMANLQATAYDAAGNAKTSTTVAVNVANKTTTTTGDTTPPTVTISSPSSGANLKGLSSVTVKSTATDNSGSSGIKLSLYIDGSLKASASGGSLSYTWNLSSVASGSHIIRVFANDAAGNKSSAGMYVSK